MMAELPGIFIALAFLMFCVAVVLSTGQSHYRSTRWARIYVFVCCVTILGLAAYRAPFTNNQTAVQISR